MIDGSGGWATGRVPVPTATDASGLAMFRNVSRQTRPTPYCFRYEERNVGARVRSWAGELPGVVVDGRHHTGLFVHARLEPLKLPFVGVNLAGDRTRLVFGSERLVGNRVVLHESALLTGTDVAVAVATVAVVAVMALALLGLIVRVAVVRIARRLVRIGVVLRRAIRVCGPRRRSRRRLSGRCR